MKNEFLLICFYKSAGFPIFNSENFLPHDQNIFSKPGEYYLAYVAGPDQFITMDLAGDSSYTMEIIDTWNMEVIDQRAAEPGVFEYRTTTPYTALRFYKE